MSDASSITKLKNNSAFKLVVNKLLLGNELTNRESTFLLSAAIALLRYGTRPENWCSRHPGRRPKGRGRSLES